MSAVGYSWNRIPDAGVWRKAALGFSALALAAAIAILPLPYAAALVLGTAVATVLVIRPELGLWLLVFSVPYGSFKGGADVGFELSLTEPLVFAVLALWLAKGVREGRVKIEPGPLYIPLLIFLGFIAVSLTTASSFVLSAKELFKWTALLAIYAYVVSNIRHRRQVVVLLCLVFVAAFTESLFGFYQFIARAGPPGFAIGPFLRAFGTFGQPNPYAGYLSMVAVAAFGLVLFFVKTKSIGTSVRIPSWGKWLVLVSLVTFAACVIAIGMSLSRGAWLGLAAGLVVVTGLNSRRAFWIMVVLIAVLALVLAIGVMQMLPEEITTRASEAVAYFGIFDVRDVKLTPENWPLVERMASWQAAWYMYEDNPLLGVGIGNYSESYEQYHLPGWSQAKGHAHNVYLNMLAETGIIGLGAYLALLACFLVHAFRSLSRLTRSASLQLERCIVTGLFGALIAMAVHNSFDSLFVHGLGVQIGIILGVISVLDKLGQHSINESTERGT